jgi:hypothetical protein
MSEEWRIESAVVGSTFGNPPIGRCTIPKVIPGDYTSM